MLKFYLTPSRHECEKHVTKRPIGPLLTRNCPRGLKRVQPDRNFHADIRLYEHPIATTRLISLRGCSSILRHLQVSLSGVRDERPGRPCLHHLPESPMPRPAKPFRPELPASDPKPPANPGRRNRRTVCPNPARTSGGPFTPCRPPATASCCRCSRVCPSTPNTSRKSTATPTAWAPRKNPGRASKPRATRPPIWPSTRPANGWPSFSTSTRPIRRWARPPKSASVPIALPCARMVPSASPPAVSPMKWPAAARAAASTIFSPRTSPSNPPSPASPIHAPSAPRIAPAPPTIGSSPRPTDA